MAIMIPSVISPEVKSSAERKIFEWFQNAPGTDGLPRFPRLLPEI